MESQKRNRRWILLKQLLLLATRMAVVAVLVLMLAHLVLRNEWLSLLGRGTTHHLVLLDDSYSMSDRWDDTTALAEGKRAVQAIVDQAAQQSDTQLITLLRFSEAAALSAGAQPKVFAEQINDTFRSKLESLLAGWEPSQTDVGPADALKAIPRLPLEKNEETLIVYLVSDFRNRQFASATDIRKLLADLKEKEHVAQIHLVRCVREARPNLAITSLVPESGVRAAGVEMWMSVTVANYGDAPARGVTVQLEQDGDALPALVLDDIPARDEITHKFRVQFAGIGGHSLTASLGADAVDVDNRRYFACDLPAARPVLSSTARKDGRGGHQLSLALAPGGNTRTGWQPHVEPPSFLADAEKLNQQAAVYLLDVPRLADDELTSLENYVRGGGGVAFFVGADTDRSFYNDRLYHDGQGLFPAPLKLPTQLMDRGDTPDVQVTAAPDLPSPRRPAQRFPAASSWSTTTTRSKKIGCRRKTARVQVIARVRNNQPLVIEKKIRQRPRRRPAHQTLLRRHAARQMEQLEPEPRVPRAGERANQLPRRRAASRPAPPGRRRPHRHRRRRQIRPPLPLRPPHQIRTAKIHQRRVACSGWVFNELTHRRPPRSPSRRHRRQQPAHRQTRTRRHQRHLRSPTPTARPAPSSTACSPSTCPPAKATSRSLPTPTSLANSPASTTKCTTPKTWPSMPSSWPASKWATPCWSPSSSCCSSNNCSPTWRATTFAR